MSRSSFLVDLYGAESKNPILNSSVNIICEETARYSFVSHLSAALRREGISISVFADTDLDYRNQGATLSVVVFSESNAFSLTWVDNFAKVLELRRNNGHKVTPVFYGVDPSGTNQGCWRHRRDISLDTSSLIFDVNPDAFKKMVSLRFLKVYNSYSENAPRLNFPKGLNSLPCELRLLHWENYPFEYLPQGFDLHELVELNMPYSQLKKLRARTKNLEMLKRIRLCHSQQLVEFDIPFEAQSIELIDLQGCTRLESFPAMTKSQHLRVLNLTGCRSIKTVPGLPPHIEELNLQGTSIEEIPISIVAGSSRPNCKELMNHMKNFPGLEHVDLEKAKKLIKVSPYDQGFRKLVRLNIKDCFHLRSLPDMYNLESLQVLDLSGCLHLEEIKCFPRNMKELYLAGTSIRELPYFPESLEFLNAHDCYLLKSVWLLFEQLPRH
ncbi:PREDICTED: probable WRKY transcription factor 16 [Camelina sativa]|uniref:Probable WRKY transcription factor 16 n=1 Tax=Camelina sativa TaxID=90675 RepID=A0ABM1QTH0_CAMSA|nr:PREDICTED: probable WRKY transcription factor 16 [Camelina sativa]